MDDLGELRLRHVGYVTEELDQLVARFREIFDLSDEHIVLVPDDDTPTDTRFAFLSIGDATIEIIEPVTDRFRQTLLDSGRGINHLCFTVDDIDRAIQIMRDRGVRPGHVTPEGAIQMPHQRMVYFDPADTAGALIEFIEPS